MIYAKITAAARAAAATDIAPTDSTLALLGLATVGVPIGAEPVGVTEEPAEVAETEGVTPETEGIGAVPPSW